MRRAIVEISPVRISLLERSGDRQLAFGERAVEHGPGESDSATWLDSIATAGAQGPLGELVRDCNAANLPTTVVIHRSGIEGASIVHSCPLRSGGRAARSAALLALDAACKFDRLSAPHDVFVAAQDSVKGETSKRHTVAFALPDSVVSTVRHAIEQCGLRFDGVVPGDALAAVTAVRSAISSADSANEPSATPRPTAFVWIEAASACLCVAHGGQLLLIRNIPIGLDALIESLSKPVRSEGQAIACVRFDRLSARRMLATTGVPRPDAQIEGHPGLTGSNLLPLLQPVLQRLAVEIKQSVRFGLPEACRKDLALTVIGPAAEIPRLGVVIASLAGLPAAEHTSGQTESAQVSLQTLSHLSNRSLRSNAQRIDTLVMRSRALAVVGTIAALFLVGFTVWTARTDRADAERELHGHESAAEQARERLALAQRVGVIRSNLLAFESRIESARRSAVPWPAVLSWLAQNTSERIKLTSIDCDSAGQEPTLRLTGVAQAEDQTTLNREIASLLSTLREWPPAERVQLRHTEQLADAARPTATFEITVSLVRVPASTPSETSSSSAASVSSALNAGQEVSR